MTEQTADVPALAHEDYTPRPGTAFTRDMAEAFVSRYRDEVLSRTKVAVDDLRRSYPDGEIITEVFTADVIMTINQGSPYVRGLSDSLIFVGHASVVGEDWRGTRIVAINFDTEEVFIL